MRELYYAHEWISNVNCEDGTVLIYAGVDVDYVPHSTLQMEYPKTIHSVFGF